MILRRMYGREVMIILLSYSGAFAITFNAKDLFEMKTPTTTILRNNHFFGFDKILMDLLFVYKG